MEDVESWEAAEVAELPETSEDKEAEATVALRQALGEAVQATTGAPPQTTTRVAALTAATLRTTVTNLRTPLGGEWFPSCCMFVFVLFL